MLHNYLRKIEKVYQTGNATEHTYRPTLKELLETLFPGISATNEPKRIKFSPMQLPHICRSSHGESFGER
jgi:hypothetical protein